MPGTRERDVKQSDVLGEILDHRLLFVRIEVRRAKVADELALPPLHLFFAERALQQQTESVVLGGIHLEDGASDDVAQRRLVPRVGEPIGITEANAWTSA